MTKTLFYAVHGNGQGCVYIDRPVRDERSRFWMGRIIGTYSALVSMLESEKLIRIPVITWDDEPVELELNLEVCSERPH